MKRNEKIYSVEGQRDRVMLYGKRKDSLWVCLSQKRGDLKESVYTCRRGREEKNLRRRGVFSTNSFLTKERGGGMVAS